MGLDVVLQDQPTEGTSGLICKHGQGRNRGKIINWYREEHLPQRREWVDRFQFSLYLMRGFHLVSFDFPSQIIKTAKVVRSGVM